MGQNREGAHELLQGHLTGEILCNMTVMHFFLGGN